jgi:DNA-binding transcriptional LysR family regulator
MRYNFDNISAYIRVVETGSISAAALRLDLAKSVVSKRIHDLEAELGVELLHRSTRGMTPTDQGLLFYQRARDIMQQLMTAADEIADRDGDLCGQLRMSAPMSFGTMYLGPLLFPFLAQHPRLELALSLDDRVVDLLGEGYDLAIRIGRLQDSSLIARKLAGSERIVCCSPDYARRAGLPTTLEEIQNHTCIGYANVHSSQIWQFEPAQAGGEIRSLVIRSRIVLNNGEAMRDAAIAGLGLVVLPRFIVAGALARGELIDALPTMRPLADTIYAIYPHTRHVARKLRTVIDHLVSALAGEPPWERLIRSTGLESPR